MENPIPLIKNAKHDGEILYCYHALLKMSERQLKVDQIEQALNSQEVEVLEIYPQIGRPSPECLILGKNGGERFLHILVAYPNIEVITTYEPKPPKWLNPWEREK